METNTSSENGLIQLFSKKEVRFCEKNSILYYTKEDSVESLNNSSISMTNDNSLLCPSTCSMLKDSSEVKSSPIECMSNDCLDNLPEAVVILEKVPEDLIQEHSYLDSVDIECSPVPMAIQNTDKSCSLNSDLLHEKMTESVESRTSLTFKKEKYSLLNLKVSIPRLPDNFREIHGCHVSEKIASETCPPIRTCLKSPGNKVYKLNGTVKNAKAKSSKISRNQNIQHSEHSFLQNSFDRLPSLSRIERSKCVGKNSTKVNGIAKSVDSNASVFKKYIASQENHNEVTFDKYPCIHLEKLDIGPYLEGISHSLDYFGVPKNSKLDMENAANISDFSKPKKNVQINKEDCFKSLSAPIKVEYAGNLSNLSDLSEPDKNISLNEDICSITTNLSALVINVDSAENAPNTSDLCKLEKSAPSNEGVCPKNVNLSASVIDTEGGTANASGLFKHDKDVFLNKEVSSESVKSVLPASYEMSCSDKSLEKNESIVKDTTCENSSLYKNVPYVLLERLPLPLVEMHMNYDTILSESTCTRSETDVSSSTDLVATVTDVPDLPIQIKNVCSISKKIFNKKQKEDKNISNKSSLFYKHQFKKNTARVVKHKSKFSTSVKTFKNVHSVSNNSSSDEDEIPLLKTFKNVHSISDNSSDEDEIPLLSISKKKLINAHSLNDLEDSSSNDTSVGNLANTNASLTKTKNSSISTHKHKKKNLMHNNQKCISAVKNKSPSLQTLCSISKKVLKNKKCSKSVELSHSEKKKKKKSLRKKRLKIYKMIMKYLKIQIKSKKYKKKSKKRKKSQQKNSKTLKGVQLVSSAHSIESDDSIAMIYDSNEKNKDCAKDENDDPSSTSVKNAKTKLHKKLNDKYRLGFLSNKVSLRFYNRFLASERLLLSKSKLKKNKKKELKKLFNRLKAAGMASKFV